MTTAFQDALATIRDQQEFLQGCSEAKTIKHAIDPLLLSVGWNIHKHEETYDQYPLPNGKRVDYSLRVDGESRIFVEAKEWNKKLNDRNRDQLHQYCLTALKDKQMSSNGHVPCLGVLTDGRHWRFYVAPDKTNHKLRQMDPEIDIISDDKKRVQDYFTDFLARKSVQADQSIKDTLTIARRHHREFVKSIAIRNKLIKAWNSLARHPKEQEDLLAHFASIRKIQAEQALIEDLIKSTNSLFNPVTVAPKSAKAHPTPTSFTLNVNGVEETVPIEKWAQLNLKLCEFMYARCPETFSSKVLSISQYWFSKTSDNVDGHAPIKGSGISVRTHGAATAIKQNCRKIVTSLGYSANVLTIQEA